MYLYFLLSYLCVSFLVIAVLVVVAEELEEEHRYTGQSRAEPIRADQNRARGQAAAMSFLCSPTIHSSSSSPTPVSSLHHHAETLAPMRLSRRGSSIVSLAQTLATGTPPRASPLSLLYKRDLFMCPAVLMLGFLTSSVYKAKALVMKCEIWLDIITRGVIT